MTVSSVALVFGPAACSGGTRPLVDDTLGDGSPGQGGGGGEGGTRVDGGDGGKIPESCGNTVKDGNETDVDCGGNECPKCIDGKVCIATTDCAGNGCIDQKCATPACNNTARDGDETDVNCGGKVCAKCTTGRRCTTASDCVSGACQNELCRCPKGMAEVSRAGGDGAYCVDEIEVTKFQYNQFITANVPINDQTDVCKGANATFVPRAGWVPAVAPPYLPTVGAGLAFNYSLPVHYVDWCDAAAYCKWANKQVCGAITGGPVDFNKPNDATADSWFNACSTLGTTAWPYGNEFRAEKCNGGQGLLLDGGAGGPLPQNTGYGFESNGDEGLHQLNNGTLTGSYSQIDFGACFGGATGLYQMSGSVGEWENSCESTSPTGKCRIRGGSYKAGVNNASALRCDAVRTLQRVPPASANEDLADVGIRCCLY